MLLISISSTSLSIATILSTSYLLTYLLAQLPSTSLLRKLGWFSSNYYEGNNFFWNFCVILFGFLDTNLFLKWVYSKRKEFAHTGSRLFPFRVGSFYWREAKTNFERVVSPVNVSLSHIKRHFIIMNTTIKRHFIIIASNTFLSPICRLIWTFILCLNCWVWTLCGCVWGTVRFKTIQLSVRSLCIACICITVMISYNTWNSFAERCFIVQA